jgi:2-iminobutanoate/2-iminopropanoate deaminase
MNSPSGSDACPGPPASAMTASRLGPGPANLRSRCKETLPGIVPERSSGTGTLAQENPGLCGQEANTIAPASGAHRAASGPLKSTAVSSIVSVRLDITRDVSGYSTWRCAGSVPTVSVERTTVAAQAAPAAIGPYSHAVRAGELLFCSGQIPLDPATGELTGATAAEQARRCLENLSAVCEAAGARLGRAVRITVYMTDLAAFSEVNEVYGSFFEDDPPARVAIEVAGLPRGAQVEIDAIVAL